MKGSRLKDVLDDKLSPFYDKFVELHRKMEDTNPNIDNIELRWVENIIDKMDDGYQPVKNDLLTANLYWKTWNLK